MDRVKLKVLVKNFIEKYPDKRAGTPEFILFQRLVADRGYSFSENELIERLDAAVLRNKQDEYGKLKAFLQKNNVTKFDSLIRTYLVYYPDTYAENIELLSRIFVDNAELFEAGYRDTPSIKVLLNQSTDQIIKGPGTEPEINPGIRWRDLFNTDVSQSLNYSGKDHHQQKPESQTSSSISGWLLEKIEEVRRPAVNNAEVFDFEKQLFSEDWRSLYAAYCAHMDLSTDPQTSFNNLIEYHMVYFGTEYRANSGFFRSYFRENIDYFLPVIPLEFLVGYPALHTLVKRTQWGQLTDKISENDADNIAHLLSDWLNVRLERANRIVKKLPNVEGQRSGSPLNPFITISDIDRMSGYDFERFLKQLFERVGYDVVHTQLSGDQGADLILSVDNRKIVVQAKRYSGDVGNSAIQEVAAAKGLYSATRGIVVCNRSFTRSAMELAAANSVELIDREKLSELLSLYKLKR